GRNERDECEGARRKWRQDCPVHVAVLDIWLDLERSLSIAIRCWRSVECPTSSLCRCSYPWGRHLAVVNFLDYDEGPQGRTDNEWPVLLDEAPNLHERGALGASLDRLPAEHLVSSFDRRGPLHRVQDICAHGGGRTVENLRRLLG